MPGNNSLRDREIREVINHLSSKNGHNRTYIRNFIRRNYFIEDYYDALNRVDKEPVDAENASIIYKKVMNNEYFDL